jgi:galactokinase
MLLDPLVDRSAALFTRCFGHSPRWIVAAPGRVNLIGEHTDYNEGFVLPMAIERYMVMAGDRNAERKATLHSITAGETATFSLRPPITRGEPAWSNYVRGVVAGFLARGRKVSGFDAVIDSGLPYGGGLASSAALEVAAATLLEKMGRPAVEPMEKALLCQQAEHEFGGVPCGLMDQFTSVLAQENHALLLDCRSRTATPVPITDPSISVLIINTHVRHKLADGEYAKRRSQCEAAARALKVPSLRDATLETLRAAEKRLEPVVFRRARHVISENERVQQMARAIQAGDWTAAGRLMYASHASLRDDYEVSCQELDIVVEIARTLGEPEGVIGCRMTGAGFGGCAVSLVRTEALKPVTRHFEEAFEKKTRTHATIFSSRPAGGARVLEWRG